LRRLLLVPIGLLMLLAIVAFPPTSAAPKEPVIQVTGLVDHPYNITLSELEALPQVSERVTCRCVGWPPDAPGVNGYDVYTYDWSGVPVATLLEKAGVKQGAIYVIFYASDGYSSGLQMQYAMDSSIIIATKADSASLDLTTGYPFREVVPGWYGYKWVKFVDKIEVVDYIYKGTWESAGYSDVAIINTPASGGGVNLTQFGAPLAVLGVLVVAVGIYLAGRPRD
jgi:DMSO/TMAO reductase YedYZ molybdopterin-dependent catalytic subunit